MPLPLIPNQACYFYTNAWTQEMDSFFVHTLVSYKSNTGRLGEEIQSDDINRAQHAVNSQFGCNITEEVLIHRVDVLAQRYRNFKRILKHNGVQFDPDSNTIIATDAIWQKIFEVYIFLLYSTDSSYF